MLGNMVADLVDSQSPAAKCWCGKRRRVKLLRICKKLNIMGSTPLTRPRRGSPTKDSIANYVIIEEGRQGDAGGILRSYVPLRRKVDEAGFCYAVNISSNLHAVMPLGAMLKLLRDIKRDRPQGSRHVGIGWQEEK